VVIQGAGYIALEFAGIFNALGAHVTVVNRSDKILRSYDESLTDRLLTMMRARGVEFRFNAPIEASSSSRTARSASTPRVSCRLRRTWCWSPPGASPRRRGWGWKTPGWNWARMARFSGRV
jgi:glutathione reductase (NADPH)